MQTIKISEIDLTKTPDLYRFTPRLVKQSLEVAKQLPDSTDTSEVIFHFYWRVPKDFSRKQVLPLLSTLVTQRKIPTKIWLWSNIDLSAFEDAKPLKSFIEFKIWDPRAESVGTPIEGMPFLQEVIDDPVCWLGGDLFRLLCLYKYGGVYIDMDVVVLRDFSPLLDHEFMYQWGSSGTTPGERELMINGAVMRLKAKSALAERLILTLAKTPGVPKTPSWGRDLYGPLRRLDPSWAVLPCAWFNTEWGFAKPVKPFTRRLWVNKYPGAFAWHWHNEWDAVIEKGSKFELFERDAWTLFQKQYPDAGNVQ